jgi:hypothetical protein
VIETLNRAALEYERLRDIWERLEGIGGGQHVPGAPCRPGDDVGPPRDNSSISTTSKVSSTTATTAPTTPLNASAVGVQSPGDSPRRHERLVRELGISPRDAAAGSATPAVESGTVQAILSPRDDAADSSSVASSTSVASTSAARRGRPSRGGARCATRTLDRSGTTGSASLREAKQKAVSAEAARSAPDLKRSAKRRTLRAVRAEPTSPKSREDVLKLTSGGVPRYSDAVRSVHAKVVQRRASDDQLSSDLSSSPKPSNQALAKTLGSVVTRGRESPAGLTKSQTRDDSTTSSELESSGAPGSTLAKLTTADVLPSAIALELLDLDDGSQEFGRAVGRSGRFDQVRKLVFGTTDASDDSDGMRDASDSEKESPTAAAAAAAAAPAPAAVPTSLAEMDVGVCSSVNDSRRIDRRFDRRQWRCR